MRRNNGVRLEGVLWIASIECRTEGLAVWYRVRTDRSWMGGHHECLALSRMAAEVMAFTLSHQIEKTNVTFIPNNLSIKMIVDALNNQHPIQATFDGWAWSDHEVNRHYFVTDAVYFHIGEHERKQAAEFIDPLDRFFKQQVQPMLVTQSRQETIPRNKLCREGSPPLLQIAIPQVDYDALFN